MHSRATNGRSESKCQGKWPDQTLDQAFGLPEVLVAVSSPHLSCKRAGKTLMPVWDSSGESRLNRQNVLQRLNQQTGIISDLLVLLNVEEQPRCTRGVHPTCLGRTVRETPLRVRGAA